MTSRRQKIQRKKTEASYCSKNDSFQMQYRPSPRQLTERCEFHAGLLLTLTSAPPKKRIIALLLAKMAALFKISLHALFVSRLRALG